MKELIVIKIGGKVLDNESLYQEFLESFVSIQGLKLLVHGGGKTASEMEERLGLPTKMIDGRRITSDESLEVMVMVYGGLVNKSLTAALQAKDCNAIGITGSDGNIIQASRRPAGMIDFGNVGDVTHVNLASIEALLDAGFIPVIGALTHDGQGNLLNTNADTIAAAIATTASAKYRVSLVYCFEKQGILSDPENENTLMKHIPRTGYNNLKKNGSLHNGIIPKIENSFYSIENGVAEVVVCNPSNLGKITKSTFSGTRITGNEIK